MYDFTHINLFYAAHCLPSVQNAHSIFARIAVLCVFECERARMSAGA